MVKGYFLDSDTCRSFFGIINCACHTEEHGSFFCSRTAISTISCPFLYEKTILLEPNISNSWDGLSETGASNSLLPFLIDASLKGSFTGISE